MSEGSINTECSVCGSLDANNADRWQVVQSKLGYQGIIKYLDLRKAASRGCKICSIILAGIKAFRDVLGRIGKETQVLFRCNPPIHPLQVGIQENEGVGARWLEFFTLAGKPAPWTAFGTANFVPERVDVNIAARTISQWLHDCTENHGCAGYHRSSTILPTRVLDLGSDPNPQDPIKLFETGGIEETYMTLSHCWGPAQLITTTENTIKQRVAGILLEELPQTFKDAVSLTRNLGIQYLWIDSLCIKQLDKQDWETEARKMGSVYANSYLNIAATSSAEGRGGIFKERVVSIAGEPSPSAIKSHKSHKIVRPYLGSCVIYVHPLLRLAHTALDKKRSSGASLLSPLLSRAWVYQERLLAPRTIHFHATEMLWECIRSSRCECGGLDRERIDTLRPNIFGGDAARDIADQWFEVVQQYSGLNASHPSDKLPALSGIAEQFHEKLQCDYLAGLWHSHLLRALTWTVADGNKACRRPPYRAPTWSWASLDRLSSPALGHQGVRVTYTLTKSIRQDNRLAVDTACVRTVGENRYGIVCEGGFIILKAAFLTPSMVEIETEVLMTGEIESILLLQFEGHEKKVLIQPDIAFTSLPLGIQQAPYDSKELRWLFLGEIGKQHYGLLLVPSNGQKDVYERVGLGRIYLLSANLKDNAEVATFMIV